MLDLTIESKDKNRIKEIEKAYNDSIKETVDISDFIKILRKRVGNSEIGMVGMNIVIKDKETSKVIAKILI